MSQVWINGEFVDKLDARISPFDHGFLYGDGVWEHLRVFQSEPYCSRTHLQQLEFAAHSQGISLPYSSAELREAILHVVSINERTDAYVRIIVSRGPGTLGPDPRKVADQVLIIAEEYQPFPRELYGHGLHAITVPVPTLTTQSAPRVRTLGQPHLVQAKRAALQQGCLEAILLGGSAEGRVVGLTEGSLLVIKDLTLVVPEGQLHDVMAARVATLASPCVNHVAEYPVQMADILAADELVLAGTACGVIGIVMVNGQPISSGREGPITQMIREHYQADTCGTTA